MNTHAAAAHSLKYVFYGVSVRFENTEKSFCLQVKLLVSDVLTHYAVKSMCVDCERVSCSCFP